MNMNNLENRQKSKECPNAQSEKTILLVEDEYITAIITSEALQNFGFKVITANTGEAALEMALSDERICLLLMDIDLGGGIDGPEAARLILEKRNIPIVFLTSHTELEYVDRVKAITRYGYIIKNSGDFVLRSSIDMAFELFEAHEKTSNELMERKQVEKMLSASENRYRRLFETAKDGILILDAETGMIVDVNPFLVKLLGYSYDLFLNKEIWDIGFLRDIIKNKDKFMELQEKEYVRYENLPLETAYGKTIDVEFVSNVYDEGDNKKVIQCNIRNITDRKVNEKKIKELLEEKQIMLKEVHHRIKNNMNTITGLLTLQLCTLKEPTAISALKDAKNRVISMMVLYDKLYRLSGDFKEVSFKEYFMTLVDEIIGNFPNNKIIKTEKNIDDFMIDAKRSSHIGIIINEIITNVMKHAFTGRNSGLITLSAMTFNNRVIIAVKDNGIGISESIDIDSSGGFGLQLVDMMTRQLSGTMKIERGQGTKFILEFNL